MKPLNPVHEQTRTATQDFQADNVITRAEQGHLFLLDWQAENPLQEQARLPQARRRTFRHWDMAAILLLMASAAVAAADLLIHLTP